MSVATTEGLIALELYQQELDGKLSEVLADLKDVNKELADSEKNQSEAIREAIAQHNNNWPTETQSQIAKLQQDIDRRTAKVANLDKIKKKHVAEIARVNELTHKKIRDCIEGTGLFDAKAGPGDAWRTVELLQISDEEIAKEFAGHGLLSVGDFADAAENGRAKELLDKGIKKAAMTRMTLRVHHYLKARGLEPTGALADLAPKGEKEDDAPEAPTAGPWNETVAVMGLFTTDRVLDELEKFSETQGDDPVKARQLFGLDDSTMNVSGAAIAALLTREDVPRVRDRFSKFRAAAPESWKAMVAPLIRERLERAIDATGGRAA